MILHADKGNYVFSTGEKGSAMDYHDYSETFRSFGIQLLSDFYLFRIPFMITSGVTSFMAQFWRVSLFQTAFQY